MQLRECLPFDVRQVMATLPIDGEVRHKLREFTLSPRVEGRARSVRDLAVGLGFSVREVGLPPGMNGRLVTDPFSDNRYSIEVNVSLSVEAKRFAVLHEMGHYFRHSDLDDPLADDTFFDLSANAFYVDENKEREANEFAEALLFGGGQLCAAASLLGPNIKKLAHYFGVTERVLSIALTKLRL